MHVKIASRIVSYSQSPASTRHFSTGTSYNNNNNNNDRLTAFDPGQPG